jgi:hypothetical protein
VPALVGQFLNDLRTVDLFVELIQNELDAHSTTTTISFRRDGIICEGNGASIDEEGWVRLAYVIGAGGKVTAKTDGIGAKNHGLRAAFLIGDFITVKSAGHRIDLTVRGDQENPNAFYPAVWPKEEDKSAPLRGTTVVIPYRAEAIEVPSGERFRLEVPSNEKISNLFSEAVKQAPSRFIAASAPGRDWQYELILESYFAPTVKYVFRCEPLEGKKSGFSRRTCAIKDQTIPAKIVERRIGTAFEIHLSPLDRGKIPRVFKRGVKIVGELNWRVDRDDRPLPATGALAYPIQYPTEHVSSGFGFDISGPFISSQTRHGISEDDRNERILRAAKTAFAEMARKRLVRLFGMDVWRIFASVNAPNMAQENALVLYRLASLGSKLDE